MTSQQCKCSSTVFLCLRSNGSLLHYTDDEHAVTQIKSCIQYSNAPIADLGVLNGDQRFVATPVSTSLSSAASPVVHYHNNMVIGPLPEHIGTDALAIKVLMCDWAKQSRKLLSRMMYGTHIYHTLQQQKTPHDNDIVMYIEDRDKDVFQRVLRMRHQPDPGATTSEKACRELLESALRRNDCG